MPNDNADAGARLLRDLGRGLDAIFGAPLPQCACGAFTKSGHTFGCPNAPDWHDDKGAPDAAADATMLRESAEYSKAERKTVL